MEGITKSTSPTEEDDPTPSTTDEILSHSLGRRRHKSREESPEERPDELLRKLASGQEDKLDVRNQILCFQTKRNPRILKTKKRTALDSYLSRNPGAGESFGESERYYMQLQTAREREEDEPRAQRQRLAVQTEEMVRERLLTRGDCDLSNLACMVPNCGRLFESLLVLAWHMSYSHTDADSDNQMHASCLVCDRQLKSVKGKNSHLVTAHRDLCILHNSQCVQQRQPQTAIMKAKQLSAEESTLEHLFMVDGGHPYELGAHLADEDVTVEEEPPLLQVMKTHGHDDTIEHVIVVDDF